MPARSLGTTRLPHPRERGHGAARQCLGETSPCPRLPGKGEASPAKPGGWGHSPLEIIRWAAVLPLVGALLVLSGVAIETRGRALES